MRLSTSHGLVSLNQARGDRLVERFAQDWPLPIARVDPAGPHGERFQVVFRVGDVEAECLLCELAPEREDEVDLVLELVIEALHDAMRGLSRQRMPGCLLPCASLRDTDAGVVVGLALFCPREPLQDDQPARLRDAFLGLFATSLAGAQLPPFASRRVVPRSQAGAIRLDVAWIDGQPLVLGLPWSGSLEDDLIASIEHWAALGMREIAWAPAVPEDWSESEAEAIVPRPAVALAEVRAFEEAADGAVAAQAADVTAVEAEAAAAEAEATESQAATAATETAAAAAEAAEAAGHAAVAEAAAAEAAAAEAEAAAKAPAAEDAAAEAAAAAAESAAAEAAAAEAAAAAAAAEAAAVEAARVVTLDRAEAQAMVDHLQRHAFARLMRIGTDAFVAEMIGAALAAAVRAGRAEAVPAALGPVGPATVTMRGFAGVEQLIRGADGETTALAVRVESGVDSLQLKAALARLQSGARRRVVVDLLARPELELPGWTMLPLAALQPLFRCAAEVAADGPVFAAWADAVDDWVDVADAMAVAVRGDARALRQPLREAELLAAFERRLLRQAIDIIIDQLAVHGVPLWPTPLAAGIVDDVTRRVLVFDAPVEGRSTLEFAIVDPTAGFASGVRWQRGSLVLFADLLSPLRHGIVSAQSRGSRRNDFLYGLADELRIARSAVREGPTAPSRSIAMGDFELFDGRGRTTLIERCIETIWVLWERHGALDVQPASMDLLSDATEARR